MDYCRQKIDAEDFHAVADAAMDLRELDREIHVREILIDEEIIGNLIRTGNQASLLGPNF